MTATNADTAEPASDVFTYPIPKPPEQDPLSWNQGKLQKYGLPRRPDPHKNERLYQMWTDTFGHTLRFLKETFVPTVALRRRESPQPTPRVPSSRFNNSPNWSGAFLQATSGQPLSQIYGQWTLPAVKVPAEGQEPVYQCGCWVGLDGQRHYLNATLPQLGTQQTVRIDASGNQTVDMRAWTQWWAMNDPQTTPVFIGGFPLAAGQEIRAVLTVLDAQSVLCNLINQSTDPPTFFARRLRAPQIPNAAPLPDGSAARYSISGATAAWVLEQPADLNDATKLLPLPDYGQTIFTSCLAAEGPFGGCDRKARTLATAHFMRMYEVRHAPERTAYISLPYKTEDAAFTVRFGDTWPPFTKP